MIIIEKKYCMNIKMKNIKYYIDGNQFIEESCIHHYVFIQFISVCLVAFSYFSKKEKIPIIITKILPFLKQENRTVVA